METNLTVLLALTVGVEFELYATTGQWPVLPDFVKFQYFDNVFKF